MLTSTIVGTICTDAALLKARVQRATDPGQTSSPVHFGNMRREISIDLGAAQPAAALISRDKDWHHHAPQ